MQHSDKPRIELAKAVAHAAAMKAAPTIDDSHREWVAFLHALERFWSKSTAHFKRSPKWGNWSHRFDQQRKQDELLSYLVNARGADEHGLDDIATLHPGHTTINPVSWEQGMSVSLETDANGNMINLKTKNPIVISHVKPQIRLLPVVNRGRTYDLPKQHGGVPITAGDAIAMADIALKFYKAFLDEAEAKFAD